MLTRLKADGFKNLVNTEIRFGPFTCLAGSNGVGKSNVFDAIRFLSLLADHSFLDAARRIRGGTDVAGLFTAGGEGVISLECDAVIPKSGRDDFHQPAAASHTFLTYSIQLALVRDEQQLERIELQRESLTYVKHSGAKEALGFEHEREWRDSVVLRSPRRAAYIETQQHEGEVRIRLSTDKMRDASKSKRGGGKPTDFLARELPRTVLSAAQNADEARTAVLARAEMRSWRILQLEPSSLRMPDEFQAPVSLTAEGRHLPATLFRLAAGAEGGRRVTEVSNRLAGLVGDVREVRVVRDDSRRLLRVVLTDLRGNEFEASSLSDGTLRFLALAVLESDPDATGVLCLEEPENGIHPERIPVMMRLLTDLATDVNESVGEGNPLRQVIVSTHSPIVVAHTRPRDLVFVEHREHPGNGECSALVVRPCDGTWRVGRPDAQPLAPGSLLRYLGSLKPEPSELGGESARDTTFHTIKAQLGLFDDNG